VPSTKRAREALGADATAGTLVVVARDGEEGCAKSFRNLDGVSVRAVDALGVADVVGARRLVLSTTALERLVELARPPAPRAPRGAVPGVEAA
jgi:large subunit ribosomal protein L4